MKRPDIADQAVERAGGLYRLLLNKYGFDDFNQIVFADGSRKLGGFLARFGDAGLIDGVMVNGSAKAVGWFASVARNVQSGYLYHYAFAMILGLLGLLSWLVIQ